MKEGLFVEGLSILIIGGDDRQVYLANDLSSDNIVKVYGLDNRLLNDNIPRITTLSEAVKGVDLVIGPIPCSQEENYLNNRVGEQILIEDIFQYMTKNQWFTAGGISKKNLLNASKMGIQIFDYLESEEMAVANAVPSAEGAIQMAMERSVITLHGSQCLVMGYGRCGKVLAHMLKGLGAFVTVEARKNKDLAYIECYGYQSLPLSSLGEKISNFDFIFNTIPNLVLDKQMLNLVNKECVLLDLASKPGGLDYSHVKKLGLKAYLCPSLPGKVAPKTAACIIKKAVLDTYQKNEGCI